MSHEVVQSFFFFCSNFLNSEWIQFDNEDSSKVKTKQKVHWRKPTKLKSRTVEKMNTIKSRLRGWRKARRMKLKAMVLVLVLKPNF